MLKSFKSLSLLLLLITCYAASGETLTFSGYEWTVRDDATPSGPGPNLWDPHNAWLDEHGWLHLKISRHGGQWHCAEVYLSENLGFGRYQWEVAGALDQFAPQIVLGLFNYTRPEVEPDGTNEIDIEYARWGKASIPVGNYTVYPAVKTVKSQTHPFDFKLNNPETTSWFDWSSKGVKFQTMGDKGQVIDQWNCSPAEPAKYIPQKPLPLHINLWLCDGKPPQNNLDTEVVIKKFTFTPLPRD